MPPNLLYFRGMEETKQQASEWRAYKFKELKVYTSLDWLADHKKKYRQVYDRSESINVYAELSFYNKLFDDRNWTVNVTLRCLSMKRGGKEICKIEVQRNVSRFDHIVYIREGWEGLKSKKKVPFLKKGQYCWEASLDGEKVGTKFFHIQEVGPSVNRNRHYLELESIRLYEGEYDIYIHSELPSYRQFSSSLTRYIYVRAIFRNCAPNHPWQCEMFTNFYNQAHELIGQVTTLELVDKDESTFKLTSGWGSNVQGSWSKGRYTAELVFMDKLIAIIPFEVDEDFLEGQCKVLLPDYTPALLVDAAPADISLADAMQELNAKIGLQAIKSQIMDYALYVEFRRLRRTFGFDEREAINTHAVFMGNPGTGKTMVAGMMGRLYYHMGLLSKGHVHVVERADLISPYIGGTAPKTKAAIESARGGVLFIDEAYSLTRTNDDDKDFGHEVIEILVKEMSNGPGDLAVIVAGYPKHMKIFLDFNPGLKSRFKLVYHFPDYLPQELSAIAALSCREQEVVLSPEAQRLLDDHIVEAYRNRDSFFGNARFIHDLIERAKVAMGLRIMRSAQSSAPSHDELSTILGTDIESLKLQAKRDRPKIPVDEKLLAKSLEELHQLTGLENIKFQIREMVDIVRYHQAAGRSVLNQFYMHTVFIGNPGTGKTTVARILARIYKSLGILERGHMVETDRQGLVAGFVGQTAIKTAEKIEEAMGGVLFIDEAYSLTQATGGQDDFGHEVIQTIIKRMEDRRGEFFVFAAGYPDNMEAFLKANPGLSSRFDKILHFEDFSPVELNEIAKAMIAAHGMRISRTAMDQLRGYIKLLYDYRDKYFGNARTIRQVIQDLIRIQNLRMAKTPADTNSPRNLITVKDVNSLDPQRAIPEYQRQSIGFRKTAGAQGSGQSG